MFENTLLAALFFGALASVSLPIGAIAGIFWNPRKWMVAGFIAFGGGALLSALTIEIIGEALHEGEFKAVAIGAILGSIIFIVLNDLVNNHGGFLRKAGTTVTYLRSQKAKQMKSIIKKLSEIDGFHEIPAEEVQALSEHLTCQMYKKGSKLARQGAAGDSMFIIEKGHVDIIDDKQKGKIINHLSRGAIVGEMALLTGEPRSATVQAKTDTMVWSIMKEDFDHILHESPTLAKQIKKVVARRIKQLKDKKSINATSAKEWAKSSSMHIEEKIAAPTQEEIMAAAKAHEGAPVAIWLGSLLDGIPASFVIGSSLIAGKSISLAIVAAFFLANFPESLSSAIGMRQQEYKRWKILAMWFSQMIIISLGALIGNLIFSGASHGVVLFIDGIAAGAMMTVIAETMLPEAYHQGGKITGFATLFGFLAAVFFKTL